MKTRLFNALNAVLLLLIPTVNFAQAPPLGTAADFVLFTSVGAVTNVGTYKYLTHLTGNVGSNIGSSTNFGNVNGVMHDGDGASSQCATDLLFAYNSLNAAIPDSSLGPVIGNGTTLKAKTYFMPTATSLNLGLTLNAQGNPNAVFIFKTSTAVAFSFTANPNAKIYLINGAKACNVFWLVSGAVNIGAGASMKGTIVSGGAIIMSAQDTLEGRALTINGAITVSNGALGFLAYTPIGCGSPYLTGPAAPTFVGLASYEVFATTGLASDCGTSRVIGDVGGNTVQPTGWNPDSVTGTVHFNDPSTQSAAADLLLIYNNLLGLAYDIQLLDPAEFGHNLVLTPHTYQMNAAVTFTDTLYLDAMGNADAVFIIKTFGAFATTPGSKVLLVNGTQSKNVYWFVTGAVSITANSIFKGAIFAHDAITVLTGAKLDGRVFSTNGAISTCGMTATIPSTSIITTQPSNRTACAGSSVSFSVIATGTGLTYQWRKGTSNLINGGTISGVTSSTVTINPVSISDAATNYNVVIAGTVSPSVTSNNASLVVNPLPAAVAGTDRVLCTGSTTTTLGAAPVVGSTYSWTSVPVGFTSTLANPTVTPTVTTTYTVVETITATGCTNTHSVVVTVASSVGTPTAITISAGTDPTCQLTNGTTTTTYATTAINSTGFNWSLSNGSAGSIGATTGVMTWANGFSGTVNIQVTASGCNGPSSQVIRTVTITPTVGTPTAITVSSGTQPTCQLTNGTTTTTYATTSTNSTGFNWSLSNGLAGSIDATTGIMTWANGFLGTVNIQVTANGCNGPSSQVIRTVTITPTVGTPTAITISAGTQPTCQLTNGTTTNTYATTATNSTGFNWSLSNGSAGSISATTGVMTWANGFSGTVNIQVTASGCNGPSSQVIRTVTITPTVGTPTAITVSAGTEPNCQLTNGTTTNTYATTATNSTGYNWSLSNGSAGSIDATTGIMTWTNGFSGTVNIQVTANGCNGPSLQVIRTVIITPTVGIPTAITISAGTDPACQLINGTTTTTYATTATNNTGFNWSLSNGSAGSIGATTGIMTWANGFSGTVNIQVTANGCNGPSLQVIRTVTVIPTVGTPVFTLGSTSTRCQGAGTVIYAATATNNTGITYILDPASLAVGNSIVAATGAVTYVAGWVGVSLITASATGCNGPSTASHLATTNPRPGPTLTGPASVCPGATGNVYITDAGMTSYSWIVSAGGTITTGGTPTSNTVTVNWWNTPGTQTVSVNYTNAFSCPALAPTVFNVTINPLPVPTISGPTSICMGSTGNVYTTQAGMTGYTWAVSAGGTFTGGGTNVITVTWNTAGAKTVSVNYINGNGCTAAASTVFNVTVNVLPVPTITGQSSMCVNTGYYNYTTESGMTNYVWSVSGGGVLNYGSGTNQIQVTWINGGPQTVSVNYSNGFGCNAATPTVFNVTVNSLPSPAGTITGITNVCAGTNGVAYTVAPIPNTSTYIWTLPPYATIASGTGTNSITVNYGINALSGNIFVYGNNLCGNGASSPPLAITVNALPTAAGNIIGPASVCQCDIAVYTVPAIAGATGYIWTVPPGATIVSGANTNAINVDFCPAALSGNITVLGTNSCGNGTVSPNFAVTVHPVPSAPFVVNVGYTAYSTAPTGNQWYYSPTQSGTGVLIPGATAQTYDATLTGTGWYWSIVTLNGCSSDTSNHKYIIIVGIDTHSSSAISVYPNPNEGVFTLMITSPMEEKYNLRVFNNIGVPIFEMKNLDVVGTTRQTIDLSSASSGIYTIVIWSNNYSSVKKVVVSK